MTWVNDKRQVIAQEFDRREGFIRRSVRRYAEVQPIIQDFARNVPRINAMNGDFDFRVLHAEACESREKGMNRTFIYAKRKASAPQAGKVLETPPRLRAKIQHALGILDEQRSCFRQFSRTRAPHQQGLANPVLQLAHGNAHCRLCAVKPFRCP